MGWGVYSMECRICGHEWTGVIEDGGELDNCECPNCGHMTGEAPDGEDDET